MNFNWRGSDSPKLKSWRRSCKIAQHTAQCGMLREVPLIEQNRAKNIARNLAYLESLGLGKNSVFKPKAVQRLARRKQRKPKQRGLPATRRSKRVLEAEQAALVKLEEEEQRAAAQQVAYTLAMNTAHMLSVHTPASGRSTSSAAPVRRVSSELYEIDLNRLAEEVAPGLPWCEAVMTSIVSACAAALSSNTRALYDFTDDVVVFANCLFLQTGSVENYTEGCSTYVRWTGPAAVNPASYRAVVYNRLVATSRVGHSAVIVADACVQVDGQPFVGSSTCASDCEVLNLGTVVDVSMHCSSGTPCAQTVTVTVRIAESSK